MIDGKAYNAAVRQARELKLRREKAKAKERELKKNKESRSNV